MGRWTDIAVWLGPIVNSGDGDGRPGEPEDRMSGHVGVVLHIAQGSYIGTISWQRNPDADVGSHFVFAKDGRRAQMIDTDERSWCQSAGNSTWISIENEGYNTQALTLKQVEACAQVLAKAHQVYGVPFQISDSPSVPGLGWHGMGGAAWGGHYDCPGPHIKAQRGAIIARAREIINPPTATAEEDDDMYYLPIRIPTDSAQWATKTTPPVNRGAVPWGRAWLRMCNDTYGVEYGVRIAWTAGDGGWQVLDPERYVKPTDATAKATGWDRRHPENPEFFVVKSGVLFNVQPPDGTSCVNIRYLPVGAATLKAEYLSAGVEYARRG